MSEEEVVAKMIANNLDEDAIKYAEEDLRRRSNAKPMVTQANVAMNKANANFAAAVASQEAYAKAVATARANMGSDYMRHLFGGGTQFNARIKSVEEMEALRAADAKNQGFGHAYGVKMANTWDTRWASDYDQMEQRVRDANMGEIKTDSKAKQVKEHKYLTPMFLGGPYDGSRLQVDRTTTKKALKDDEGFFHTYVERTFHSQPTQAGQSTVYRLFVLETLTSEQIMTALVDGYAGYFADNA
jgi:hypothetical protein